MPAQSRSSVAEHHPTSQENSHSERREESPHFRNLSTAELLRVAQNDSSDFPVCGVYNNRVGGNNPEACHRAANLRLRKPEDQVYSPRGTRRTVISAQRRLGTSLCDVVVPGRCLFSMFSVTRKD